MTEQAAHNDQITVHFDIDSATVQVGNQTCTVGNVGSDVLVSRANGGTVFTRGGYQVTVIPGGLTPPDAEPAKAQNALEGRDTKALAAPKSFGGS